jgi:hypothetical protein
VTAAAIMEAMADELEELYEVKPDEFHRTAYQARQGGQAARRCGHRSPARAN